MLRTSTAQWWKPHLPGKVGRHRLPGGPGPTGPGTASQQWHVVVLPNGWGQLADRDLCYLPVFGPGDGESWTGWSSPIGDGDSNVKHGTPQQGSKGFRGQPVPMPLRPPGPMPGRPLPPLQSRIAPTAAQQLAGNADPPSSRRGTTIRGPNRGRGAEKELKGIATPPPPRRPERSGVVRKKTEAGPRTPGRRPPPTPAPGRARSMAMCRPPVWLPAIFCKPNRPTTNPARPVVYPVRQGGPWSGTAAPGAWARLALEGWT